MATNIAENSQPALRSIGRNSNPLVANVFSTAFAIQNSQKSILTNSIFNGGPTNYCRDFTG
jgi:hypothetical protein